MNITEKEELKEREFKRFLEENGPNRGQGFLGKWAWHQMMKDQFEILYKEKNNE